MWASSVVVYPSARRHAAMSYAQSFKSQISEVAQLMASSVCLGAQRVRFLVKVKANMTRNAVVA